MVSSGNIGVTVGQLAGMALSNILTLGSLGDIIFQVNPYKVKTFETLNRISEAIYADHEVAGRKPASEMTGEALDQIDLHIVLNASLGVSPREECENLRLIKSSGTPQQLVIGRTSLGLFTIRTVSDEWVHVSSMGNVILMALDVHLVEYVETIPTQAEQTMRRDEIMRGETGKGGPDRLPGSSEVTKKRTLTPKTPKIDPITRMEIPS